MPEAYTPGEYAYMSYDGTPVPTNASSGIRARFYKDALVDPELTKKAKKRVYFTQENIYVELISAGDIKSAPVKKVTEDIKEQFAEAWAAFERGEEVSVRGTPLESFVDNEGDKFTVGVVKTLRSFNIDTLEQFAGISDTALQNMGMGYREWQTQARAFLGRAKGLADEARHKKVEDLEQKIIELQALISQKAEDTPELAAEPIKRGRGRPPLTKTISDPMEDEKNASE